MTKQETLSTIKAMGLSARCVDGEYRVTFPLDAGLPRTEAIEQAEAMAYYTNDGQDAIDTAAAMLKGL